MRTKPFLQVITLLAVVCVFTTGCNTVSKEREASLNNATAKKEIEAANSEFMALVSRGDSVELANYYAMDAKLMEPNAPAVTGRENIQTSMAGIIKSGVTKVNLRAIDVWGIGDLLAEEGELTLFDKTGTQLDKGKYTVLWKKENGKWKLFRDLFNSDLPTPSAK